MAKRFDPKAKARKQKIVAAVLGVLFLGVMAYQAPTILGLFGGGSSEVVSEPAPPPPAGSVPPAASTPVSATPAPTGSEELVDSDPVAAPAQGQLVSFDRFESKDPFAQQAQPRAATPAPPPAATPKPKRSDGGTRSLAVTSTAPKASSSPPPSTAGQTAKITVNGVSSEVTVGGTFPEADPIFKLVSLTKDTAKVGIVDGTYATGSPTITLRKGGRPVTLMNTADGTTYVLRLVDLA
jgi:hypothetical protein